MRFLDARDNGEGTHHQRILSPGFDVLRFKTGS